MTWLHTDRIVQFPTPTPDSDASLKPYLAYFFQLWLLCDLISPNSNFVSGVTGSSTTTFHSEYSSEMQKGNTPFDCDSLLCSCILRFDCIKSLQLLRLSLSNLYTLECKFRKFLYWTFELFHASQLQRFMHFFRIFSFHMSHPSKYFI